jgi:hypothetical protein
MFFFIRLFWYSVYVYECTYLIIIQARAMSNMDILTTQQFSYTFYIDVTAFFIWTFWYPLSAHIFRFKSHIQRDRVRVQPSYGGPQISPRRNFPLYLCNIANTSIRYCLHPTRGRWRRRTWCRSWLGDENTRPVVAASSRPRYPRYKSASERKNLLRWCRIWIGRLCRAWPAKIFGILMNGSVKSSPGGFIRRSVRAG